MEMVDFYKKVLGLKNIHLIKALTDNSGICTVKKGTILEHIGVKSNQLYFLDQGLLRGFLLDAKGNDVTDCFAFTQGTPVVSCLELGQPSVVYIEALEDSQLILIPMDVVLSLLKSNLEAVHIYNQLLHNALKMHWENKIALIQYTATERYQWFLQTYPGLIDRVNHKYVASFLGITPVSLSRIRRVARNSQ